MKIRTDFVTNSSSSSFSVVVSVTDKDGSTYTFEENPSDWDSDNGSCKFSTDLKRLQTMNIGSVKDLARLLMDSVIDFVDDVGISDPSFAKEITDSIAEEKACFVEEVTDNIPSVDDIAEISVDREYSAWGEFADLIPESDRELCAIAERVCSSSGAERDKALDDMLAYINTSSSERAGWEFGCGYDDIRYYWNGKKSSLLNLAKRLNSNEAVLGEYKGCEHDSVNFIDGTSESYAEFYLSKKNATRKQAAENHQRKMNNTSDKHEFKVEGSELKEYKGPGGDVVIPDGITEIGLGPFENCTNLRSVTIPDGVTRIGNKAFKGCSSLKTVTIPNSVWSIGSFAFEGCSSLESVTIPNSVTTIDTSAFEGCSNLESVTIPNSVTTISWSAFKGCSNLESVTIPDGVTRIDDHAFEGCSSLESVTIPNSVTTIDSSAFEGCSSLKTVTIPNSVWSIEDSAFKGCSSLESVTIPDSVWNMRWGIFKGCIKLADDNGLVIVRDILFDYFGAGGSVVIPDNVKRVEGGAFSDKNITQITFLGKPDSIEVGIINGIKAVFPQGALRTNKTLSAEWLNLSFDADETDLAHLIMYQKSKGWLDYVCSNSGDPALVIEHLIELMSTKKKVSKAVSENVAIYLRRHYASVPRERISWLMEYLSENKGKESDALRNDPGFKRYMSGEKAPEPAAPEKSFSRPSASDRCAGMTFVITGKVNIFVNRSEFTEYVKAHGGKVSGSVTAKTDYLVNNDINSASSKNRTAKSLGVPIISEEEFVKRFGKP